MLTTKIKKNHEHFYLITSIILLIAFAILTVAIKLHWGAISVIDSYEHAQLAYTAANYDPSIINFLSDIGSPLVGVILITIVALFLCYQKQYLNAFFCESAMIIGNVLVEVFKLTIARPRPSYIILVDSSYSFPSGHVFNTTLLILVLLTFIISQIDNQTYQIIWSLLLIIWNGFIIFSRIYLGEHYFTDTIGSIFLAVGLWAFTLYLRDHYLQRLAQ